MWEAPESSGKVLMYYLPYYKRFKQRKKYTP
jgi:hypothetical protein